MSQAKFSDSMDENIALLSDILSGQPPMSGRRAHHIAGQVERAVLAIIDSNGGSKDPIATLGVTCAIFKIAKLMVQSSEGGGKGSLIQLIN